jgi:hypothetical protein
MLSPLGTDLSGRAHDCTHTVGKIINRLRVNKKTTLGVKLTKASCKNRQFKAQFCPHGV